MNNNAKKSSQESCRLRLEDLGCVIFLSIVTSSIPVITTFPIVWLLWKVNVKWVSVY